MIFMKILILLLVFFVVLVSMCSELPFELPLPNIEIPSETQGAATIDSGSPDIYVNVETLSSEVKSGRSMQLFFELRNKQQYDLTNINFDVYDHPCFDVSDNGFSYDCKDGILRSNESCVWSSRWTADSEGSSGDRTCQIKFKVSYEATNSIFQDIVVLPQVEYNQREIDGTLNNIPIQFTPAKGPLQIYLTFSEPQPFIASQPSYSMFINYNNAGDGFFDSTDVNLVPSNNIILTCPDDYTSNHLTRTLTFVKGRSVPTDCSFSTAAADTISIRSFEIKTGYKYTLYGSFPITVRGL